MLEPAIKEHTGLHGIQMQRIPREYKEFVWFTEAATGIYTAPHIPHEQYEVSYVVREKTYAVSVRL